MMGCLIAALTVIAGYVAFEFHDGGILPDNLKAVLAASLSSIILLGPISHIVSSGDFILIYLILHLIQNLVCLRSEVEEGKSGKKNNSISIVHDIGSACSRKRSSKNGRNEIVNRINKLNIVLDIALDNLKEGKNRAHNSVIQQTTTYFIDDYKYGFKVMNLFRKS